MSQGKKLRIGFEARIYLMGNDGPKAFMKRLRASVKRQGLARVRSALLPFYDVGLFKNTNKSVYPRPFVLRADGIYFDSKEKLGPNRVLNAPIFRALDEAWGVAYISDFSRRLIERFHGKVEKPFAVIHNAVDTAVFRPDGDDRRERLGIPEEDIVILCSAHWRKWKRLEDLVKIFLELIKGEQERHHLLVLGKNPDCVVEHDRIHYAGEISGAELAAWYRTGDVYVHPAWLENCGNTQIEAMACGLPVLCSNLGGIGETVRKAQGGIVAEVDRPFAFEPVDLYNPPRPDYGVFLGDLRRLIAQRKMYAENINRRALSIDAAAEAYVDLLCRVRDQGRRPFRP